jgi:hypothetical protein
MNDPAPIPHSPELARQITDDPLDNELAAAKTRLLAYAGNGEQHKSLYKRHPLLIAGAAVVGGIVLVRVPASRVILRMGAFMLLRKVATEWVHSVSRRI